MVSPLLIREFLAKYFGEKGRLMSGGREFTMPSPFTDDYRHKFSMNLETGLWQDFSAHKKGNFFSFYAFVKGISYKRAEAELTLEELVREDSLPEFVEQGAQSYETIDTTGWVPVHIRSVEDNPTPLIEKAWVYLWDRGLFNLEVFEDAPFYVATSGRYEGRLIIPYRDSEGTIYYFQARALSDGQFPKYLNPERQEAPKASEILWDYPHAAGTEVMVVEGPLDARSLELSQLYATCTQGCSISEEQMRVFREDGIVPVIAYDNDTAGIEGLERADRLRKKMMMPPLKVCPPPPRFKDWNQAWMEGYDIAKYVEENTSTYDFDYLVNSEVERG